MIDILDIKADMHMSNDQDAYYWDALNEVGYHMHEESNGNVVYMLNTGKQIAPIAEAEFIEAVNNKCYGNSISADGYFTFK